MTSPTLLYPFAASILFEFEIIKEGSQFSSEFGRARDFATKHGCEFAPISREDIRVGPEIHAKVRFALRFPSIEVSDLGREEFRDSDCLLVTRKK
jgi:hypothetical protein